MIADVRYTMVLKDTIPIKFYGNFEPTVAFNLALLIWIIFKLESFKLTINRLF